MVLCWTTISFFSDKFSQTKISGLSPESFFLISTISASYLDHSMTKIRYLRLDFN